MQASARLAPVVPSALPARRSVILSVRPRNGTHPNDSTSLHDDLQCGWILGTAIGTSGSAGEHVGGLLGHDHHGASDDRVCARSRRSRFNIRSGHSLLLLRFYCPHCRWDHFDWAPARYRTGGQASKGFFLVVARPISTWLERGSLSLLVTAL